jgi:glycine/D-amino acid oxidase-like deaminating enzyme
MNDIRMAIVGAGLAGSLLAWRLASQTRRTPGTAGPRTAPWLDVFTGAGAPDATDASGGLVRGFEADPVASRLAAASLVELTASTTLSRWAQYQEIGSVYVCADPEPGELRRRVGELDAVLPGSARVLPAERLGGRWAGLPDGAWAVVERRAGYLRPGALRQAVLGELSRAGVGLVAATVTGITAAGPSGTGYRLRWDGRRDSTPYDIVVFAAGARTGALLAGCGLPAQDFRAKHIQYGLYESSGERPPSFVDDTSGLYGRAAAGGQVLLGVPSDVWDPSPDRPRPLPRLQRRAERLATDRFPRLRLGPVRRVVAGADCYGPTGHLALRPVPGCDGLHTFTGGGGGSAKLALAASAAAARALLHDLSTPGVHTC